MNSIIKLRGPPSQILFDEPILDNHLSIVLQNSHYLIKRAVYIILDKEFVNNIDWYRVLSDKPAIFLAMTCLLESDKSSISILHKCLFKHEYIGNIDKVLTCIKNDIYICGPYHHDTPN